MALTPDEVNDIAGDLASLASALASRGMPWTRVDAVLNGAAGQIVANVTGVVRMAEQES